MSKLFSLLLVLLAASAQAQNFQWAKGVNGNPTVGQTCVATDAAGNLYMAGLYRNMADIDPGTAVVNLTTSAGDGMFLVKLDASGNFVWYKELYTTTATSNVRVTDIALDATGNIYLAGQFNGTVDLDPGAGVASRTAGQEYDAYLLKLDNTGAFVYAYDIGGSLPDDARALSTDNQGNVYVSGVFGGTVDFDPSAGTSNLTSIGGSVDVFIAKFDNQGNFGWATGRGSSYNEVTFTVAADATAGVFATTSTPDSLTIFRMDAATGTVTWLKQIANQGAGLMDVRRIALDPNGDLYATGFYSSALDFDPGTGVVTMSPTNGNIYLLKLNNNGDFAWAKTIDAWGMTTNATLGIFDQNNIYLAASYHNVPADLDPGAGVFTVTPVSSFFDIFVARFNSSGNFISGGSVGGKKDEYTGDICFNSTGAAYLTGYFVDTVDFDPGAGVSTLSAPTTGFSAFVVKLTGTLSVGEVSGAAADVRIYPNPSSDRVMIETGSSYDTYRILNSTGAQVATGALHGDHKSIEVSALPAGVYHMILKGKDGVVTSKLTKL